MDYEFELNFRVYYIRKNRILPIIRTNINVNKGLKVGVGHLLYN